MYRKGFLNRFIKRVFPGREKGQSLVEAALLFPVFLILIAGAVEVSQLLITKNRVESAARAAARFAADGGEDSHLVALGSVEQTVDLDSSVWDIWVIGATVNGNGDGFVPGSGWSVEKMYGISNTVAYTEVADKLAADCAGNCVQDQVLKDLQTNEQGVYLDPVADPNVDRIAADLEVVAVYAVHDVDAILGLNAMPGLQGFYSIEALGVMRMPQIQANNQTGGCDGFPIAVHDGIRSLDDVGTGNPYPEADDFECPFDSQPECKDYSPPSFADFYKNVPQESLRDAKEGYIFRVYNGFGSGNFGWLQWNEGRPASATTLADSLAWPGDSTDYTDHGDSSIYPAAPDIFPHIVRGYVDPDDPSDIAMHVGDWVAAGPGSVVSAGDAIAAHVNLADEGRTIRLIVWDESEEQGNNGRYRISGFILVKLHGYSLNQGHGGSWILAEFIRWDESCGQLSGDG
ncbi:MAG: pilus assembly protein [Chloroflexi bacterium]|nr:pilus assembly protein [Chloroflexota bacterium]